MVLNTSSNCYLDRNNVKEKFYFWLTYISKSAQDLFKQIIFTNVENISIQLVLYPPNSLHSWFNLKQKKWKPF